MNGKLALTTLMILFLSTAGSVKAAKPLDVTPQSNGFPSGTHFNLNMHGKTDFACDPAAGGNSVFIDEYGDSTVSYVTNRKSAVTELVALDTCAEAFDGDPALVQLPYESQGYYVFAEVKAKPNNGADGGASAIILSPNIVREACNDTDPANPDFPSYTGCPDSDLLALGLIVGSNLYQTTNVGFVRFDPQRSGGIGKSTGVDITDLFKYSGWVFSATLDINLDGQIDMGDVPLEYDLPENGGNGNGLIDLAEYDKWLADQSAAGLATSYEDEWILNIADLVVTDQALSNDGVKLLKLRFYPVATTMYE